MTQPVNMCSNMTFNTTITNAIVHLCLHILPTTGTFYYLRLLYCVTMHISADQYTAMFVDVPYDWTYGRHNIPYIQPAMTNSLLYLEQYLQLPYAHSVWT